MNVNTINIESSDDNIVSADNNSVNSDSWSDEDEKQSVLNNDNDIFVHIQNNNDRSDHTDDNDDIQYTNKVNSDHLMIMIMI